MKLSKSVVSRLTLVSNTRATTEYWSRYVAMTHSGWGRKVQTTKLWNSKIHISLAGGRGEGKRKEKQRLTLLYKSNFHAKCSLLHPHSTSLLSHSFATHRLSLPPIRPCRSWSPSQTCLQSAGWWSIRLPSASGCLHLAGRTHREAIGPDTGQARCSLPLTNS